MKLNNALIIQPLSAAKMSGVLCPDKVLSRCFGDMSTWVETPTNDVAIIFTSGLYQNNDTPDPRSQRMSLLQREGEWRSRFQKLLRINSKKEINGFPLMPEAFLMASWDEQITSFWKDFARNLDRLKRAYSKDTIFRIFIESEIRSMGREPNEANVAFIFEEISIAALWLVGNVNVSRGIRIEDKLDAIHIAYPGSFEIFMHKGLQFLLKDKKGCLPLIWLNTSDPVCTIPTEYRFGRDCPSAFM